MQISGATSVLQFVHDVPLCNDFVWEFGYCGKSDEIFLYVGIHDDLVIFGFVAVEGRGNLEDLPESTFFFAA